MEARIAEDIPEGPGWQFEPKWDGFRCLAFRKGKEVELRSKSGKDLGRYFPEIVAALMQTKADHFILDGELIIPLKGKLSFDALQLRLHPAASRIRKLAAETPAMLMLFDILMAGGRSLIDESLPARRQALEKFFPALKCPAIKLSPCSRRSVDARKWLSRAGKGSLDGVIAKPLGIPYQPGERAMLKIKALRTADCVVGGFRYGTDSREVGSLLLGLYNEAGKLDHVGFTSGIPDNKKSALTKKLEALRGGAGFSGNAPGGPSRWSTERSAEWVAVKPKLVAEVQYDHVTGDRFRHGTKFLRWRPDKAPESCGFDQLKKEASPGVLRAILNQ
jgi:ATP-dependent DNA ligase